MEKKQTKKEEIQLSDRAKAFESVLSLISDDKVKKFCITLIDNADDYFFVEAASSTGKHHPAYANGEGGLMRHSKAVAMILDVILSTDMFKISSHNKDLLICAAIVHDIKKQGDGHTGHTIKKHPECAVEYIHKMAEIAPYLSSNDIKFLSDAVVTHMGKWGSESPKTIPQKLVHIADCLASRKFLTVEFEDDEQDTEKLLKESQIAPEEYVMPCGKHKGKKLSEVPKSYLYWAVNDFPYKNHPALRHIKKYLRNDNN